MTRRDRFVVYVLVLLNIWTCGIDAKYTSYDHILESPDYKEALRLLSPEKVLKNYNQKFATDEDTWFNSNCRRDLIILEQGIAQREMWAFTMLDASSKLQSGLLQGNLIDLGQYDECLAVQSKTVDHEIRGRHCMSSISVTKGNITIHFNPTISICLPTSCSADEVQAFLNPTISWINEVVDLKIEIVSTTCSSVDLLVWDLEFIMFTVLLSGIVIFLVACTLIEMNHRRVDAGHNGHLFTRTLARFSLRKSAASIFNMRMKQGTLPAIHGLRFLSIAWVVLGHELLLMLMMNTTVNPVDLMKWIESWKSLYIFTAQFSVDTFFAMSGFLMTYLFLKNMPKTGTFNVPIYYLHRYFRLTPSVIALIVISIVFLPKMGSGARWDTVLDLGTGSCRKNWWYLLLYVQNFLHQNDMCLGHTWYLAVDMQLFWISPLILYPLYKKPKYGLMLLAALFFTLMAIASSIVGTKKLPAISFIQTLDSPVTLEIIMNVYQMPYHRAGPWLVGISLGYEAANYNRQLNRWTTTIGWFITVASFSFCILGMRSFMDSNYEYDAVWETFFSTVCHPIWGLGVCWIIYACINNHAGPVSSILSSRIFLPLSRLSYCIYLVHFVIQTHNAAGLRTLMYFSDYYLWRSFFSTLMISIGVALVFSLLFESPVMVLEKILLKKYENRNMIMKENSGQTTAQAGN